MARIEEDNREQLILDEFFAEVAKKLVDAGFGNADLDNLRVEIIESETPDEDSQMILSW